MKRILALAVVSFLCGLGTALAQEHWTEGPVWSVSFYRTTPGHFDDYMKYLRSHYIVTTAEAKKEGLILDSKVFVKDPSGQPTGTSALPRSIPATARLSTTTRGTKTSPRRSSQSTGRLRTRINRGKCLRRASRHALFRGLSTFGRSTCGQCRNPRPIAGKQRSQLARIGLGPLFVAGLNPPGVSPNPSQLKAPDCKPNRHPRTRVRPEGPETESPARRMHLEGKSSVVSFRFDPSQRRN